MADSDDPTQRCRLSEPVDVRAALNAVEIEHLEVDADRTVVIFQNAVLMLYVIDGRVTETHAFEIELWNPPARESDRDPQEVLTAFIDALVRATDTTRR